MSPNIWPDEHSQALRRLVEDGRSYSVAAEMLNKAFSTNYTRNGAIGRGHRMGLGALVKRREARKIVRPRAPPTPRKPKFVSPQPTPRPTQEAIKLRCAEVDPRRLAITDLQPGQCRYPYGDQDFTFCGHATVEGRSYCMPHFQLCTRENTPRKPANQSWLLVVRSANVPKAIILSSGDWETA